MENQTNINEIEKNEEIANHELQKVNFHYAGFWMRFWAYLLDLIVIGSINRLLIKPIFRITDLPIQETSMFALISIATTISYFGYFIIMTKIFNQTIGKMVFGLKVIKLNGNQLDWLTVLFRELIGRFISKAVLFIGFLVVAFLQKKQGIHDIFADTTVIHETKEKIS